jgi:regulatory protein
VDRKLPPKVRASGSLKGAALRLLSRREFSRHELGQRLRSKAESVEALEQVLDDVQARKLQSDERFTESLVHRRAHQFGARRIEYELDQHRIDPVTATITLAALVGTERERALAVWRRRFEATASGRDNSGEQNGDKNGDENARQDKQPNTNEKARQYRFLAQRGFDGDTISWVLKEVRKPLC